jgi:hypothetical protein
MYGWLGQAIRSVRLICRLLQQRRYPVSDLSQINF